MYSPRFTHITLFMYNKISSTWLVYCDRVSHTINYVCGQMHFFMIAICEGEYCSFNMQCMQCDLVEK